MVVQTQNYCKTNAHFHCRHTSFYVALVAKSPTEQVRLEAAGVDQHITRVDHFPENLKEMRRVLSTFVERREFIQRDRRVCSCLTCVRVHTFNANGWTT